MSLTLAANRLPKEHAAPPPASFSPINRSTMLSNPVLLSLTRLYPLGDADRKAVAEMMAVPRQVVTGRDIVRAGDRAGGLRLLHRGFACRYIDVANGQRQITELLVPGDVFTRNAPFVSRSDANIATLTPVVYSEVPRRRSFSILDEHPRLALAVWRANMINEATLHERIANLGRRSAKERLAHLFCELFHRLEAVGLCTGFQCSIPLSQSDFADFLGLSIVHTNRSLQWLRAEELLRLDRGILTIIDADRLREVANFTGHHLTLQMSEECIGESMKAAPFPMRREAASL